MQRADHAARSDRGVGNGHLLVELGLLLFLARGEVVEVGLLLAERRLLLAQRVLHLPELVARFVESPLGAARRRAAMSPNWMRRRRSTALSDESASRSDGSPPAR